ncbi:MAG: dTMP kinase [Candidatus Thalassarchaeaceae archaeon]|nr:dTMP kinase [Candidatus Thalassarchaeaceae archaeon]
MYLITLEGGDGSGKGTATKMVEEILRKEASFTSVDVTAEPRRNHPLGRLAVESVRTGEAGPLQEAGFFAADRLDHSHMWIRPRLAMGSVVISERNVHSSLVYQGIVGDLGLEQVARLNSGAMIPDLTIWLDCDPEVALKRINQGTLRMETMDKTEYFETDVFQNRIRTGFHRLLGGEIAMPDPFNQGTVVGPIMNHGTEGELKTSIRNVLRQFLSTRPSPVNVSMQEVELNLIGRAMNANDGQQTLDVGASPKRDHEDWLQGEAPWRILSNASKIYSEAWSSTDSKLASTVPKGAMSESVFSIVGTLSMVSSVDVRKLRSTLGPVRTVSHRHTQRMIQFLDGQQGWIRRHRTIMGREAPRSELRADWQAFGRLALLLAPLRPKLQEWYRRSGSAPRWKDSLSQILKEGGESVISDAKLCIERFNVIGSGLSNRSNSPTNLDEFRRWFRGD